MRKLMVGMFLLALTAPAFAQPEKDYHGHAYIFVAPGGATGGGSTTGMLHLGGGGEGLFYKGLGVGGELGYLAPTRSFKDGVGVFSVNGAYHFVNSEKPRKLVPFVTVGYSLFFRNGHANMVNYGAGVNYWMRERMALRVEARDHVTTSGPAAHFWQFRVGLAFR